MPSKLIEPPVADWVTIPDLYDDPFPIYERLRSEGGVHWVPAVNRYLVTSYDAVHDTELDQETFSANEEGSLQIRAMGHSMLRRDDPEHYIERKKWQPVLRPGVVKRVWTEMFMRNANRYLDEFIAKGPGADLIGDFAAPYAAESLRELLGFYNASQDDLQRWSQTMIDATGNYADDPDVWARGQRSYDEVDTALDEMLQWHSNNPDNSLISSLLSVPEDIMPIEKIRANLKMTIGGGLNEPRDALGVATWALLTHLEQRAAVEADPSLFSTVFDESIRWVAPIGMYSRQTTRAVELNGVTLPAGAKLGICILSANRDESVWQNAHRFDIRREVKPHLAFGKGVHVCMGAWVAKAEVATVGLPLLFHRLRGLDLVPSDPAEIKGWVFRGMTKLPVQWNSVAEAPANLLETPQTTPATVHAPSVAIVGSGPSGCFSAQAIRRQFTAAAIDVYEKLPVPYGLVRYGVAADHQGTKTVTHQFERLFARENVRFIGNSPVDRDQLSRLRDTYDVVVLATGLHRDKTLEIAGSRAQGVVGAGEVARLLNTHPEQVDLRPLGESIAVIGMGNVAMDIVRLMVRDEAELLGSDINVAARKQLVSDVTVVHVIGRVGPEHAKFDPVMLREIASLTGVEHIVHGVDFDSTLPGKDARVDAVRDLVESSPMQTPTLSTARVRVEWWFEHAPIRIDTNRSGAVEAVTISSTQRDADPVATPAETGEAIETSIAVDAVVTAIGFELHDGGLVEPATTDDGRVEPGLYVAGWLRRGPRGTIPDQRTDAKSLARLIADDLSQNRIAVKQQRLDPGAGAVDYDGWRRIDAVELLQAREGRTREKIASLDEMVAVAANTEILLPEIIRDSGATSSDGPLVRVYFGTESGGAELVAEDLGVLLADRARVTVCDLADASPSDLDQEHFNLFICSTYGDGELPSNAMEFVRELQSGELDLSGVRYAVFGMGDRSYSKTYSRGSELLDEALAARGAERFGEYGRHDAGGSTEAVDEAHAWADGLVSEMSSLVELSN